MAFILSKLVFLSLLLFMFIGCTTDSMTYFYIGNSKLDNAINFKLSGEENYGKAVSFFNDENYPLSIESCKKAQADFQIATNEAKTAKKYLGQSAKIEKDIPETFYRFAKTAELLQPLISNEQQMCDYLIQAAISRQEYDFLESERQLELLDKIVEQYNKDGEKYTQYAEETQKSLENEKIQ